MARAGFGTLSAKDPTAAPVVPRSAGGSVSAAVGSDIRRVGLGYADGRVSLWDLSDVSRPASPVTLIAQSPGPVASAGFSPDGRWLVTATRDFRLWPFGLEILLDLAKQVAGRNFTRAEWDLHFPGQPPRKTFADLPAIPD